MKQRTILYQIIHRRVGEVSEKRACANGVNSLSEISTSGTSSASHWLIMRWSLRSPRLCGQSDSGRLIGSILLVARLAFGALFVWAALGKIIDPDAFSLQVARYEIIGPKASALVGGLLPWAEFLIGACLLLGVCAASAWLGSVILFAVFAYAKASVLHRGLSIDCGCGVMDGVITVRSLLISIALFAGSLLGYVAEIVRSASANPTFSHRRRSETVASQPQCSEGKALAHGLVAALFISVFCLPCSAFGQASVSRITRLRLQSCRSLQPAFDRIVAVHSLDTDILAVQRRLDAMDEVADAVVQQMRLRQSALLDQSLATVGGADRATEDRPLDAGTIVERYQAAFATPILLENLSANEGQTVRQYLQTAEQSLNAAIASRGLRCTASVGVDAAQIMRLAFILPVLTSDPQQDLSTPPPPMPQWMSDPPSIRLLQAFSLESQRPRLAFVLAHSSSTQPADTSDAPVNYIAFAEQGADTMLRAGQYQAALCCLRDARTIAEGAKKDDIANDIAFKIAEVLETTDSPSAAAEMAGVLSRCHAATVYSRASIMRLKYLYESAQDQAVASEAAADEHEPRCAANLPEVMYIAWLACSRTPGAGSADRWNKTFLERFPDHPLAVHLYFAAATSALAAGNTDEAIRLLNFIDYHFPDSRMIEKVHRIEAGLRAARAASAATSP